jgi:hypothetical protein
LPVFRGFRGRSRGFVILKNTGQFTEKALLFLAVGVIWILNLLAVGSLGGRTLGLGRRR